MGYSVDSPTVPFFADIHDGFPHGAEVVVEGDIDGNELGIWFELRAADGIAFHLNIRMGQLNEHKTVVNSFYAGHWQHEERHANHEINRGGPLHLTVSNTWTRYEFKINGKSYHFPHRINGKHVNRLEIRGDLRIRRLTFNGMDNHFRVLGQSNAPPTYHGGGELGIGGGSAGMNQPPQSGYPSAQPYQPYPQQPGGLGQSGPQPGGLGQQQQPYPIYPGDQPGGLGFQPSPQPAALGQPQPYQPYPSAPNTGFGQPGHHQPGHGLGVGPGHGGQHQPPPPGGYQQQQQPGGLQPAYGQPQMPGSGGY